MVNTENQIHINGDIKTAFTMNSSRPLVSIIILNYNAGDLLLDCVDSIKKSHYDNFEIILVDNNSSDNTVETAKKYHIKVFNFGPERSAQRNFGAKKALGRYLFFLDAMALSLQ